MGLGLEDVGGNLEPNPFLVHTYKKRVALKTAAPLDDLIIIDPIIISSTVSKNA